MSLDSVVGPQAATIRSRIEQSPFRRLSHVPETRIDDAWLCQAIHIDRRRGAPRPLVGDGEDAHCMHSTDSAKAIVERAAAAGIGRLYLGPHAEPGLEDSPGALLDRFVQLVADIRREAGPSVELVVDPAGLCMGQDLRWGVRDPEGKIDAEATLALLGRAAGEFVEVGADSLMTIGRINCEVEVTRAALDKCSRPARILSFSTNSETTSAYFEATRYDISRSHTGQKILVGNGYEMMVRGLCDYGEGSDVLVQKPIEALHELLAFRLLATRQLSISALVEAPEIAGLLDDNPWIRPALQRAVSLIGSGERPLKTGTYEVSGTFCTNRLIARKYGDDLAWSMLDELYKNAASAARGMLDIIISRSAIWYVEHRARLGRAVSI